VVGVGVLSRLLALIVPDSSFNVALAYLDP
jgi:hypothetical protein